MWSANCFDVKRAGTNRSRRWPVSALLVLMVFAGCASTSHPTGAAVDSSRAIPPRVRTSYEQAVAIMAAGDLTEAELRFDAFLLEHPGYPGAYVNLAIMHSEQGDDAAAEASIRKALELDPRHAAALNQLGILRRRQGRFDEAESAYLKAITADPGYGLAHYNLGVLYELYLQRLEPALQHFETYQELGAGDEQVARWIVDLRRRVEASQRTANAME